MISEIPFQPDYRHMLDVLANRRPARLPLYEHKIDPAIMEQVLAIRFAELEQGDDADLREFFRQYARFYREMTYDTLSWEVTITRSLPDHGAIYGSRKGPIQTREDFDRYPWKEIPEWYWATAGRKFEAMGEMLPVGMKALGGPGNGVFEISEDLVGYQQLAYMMVDDPDLFSDLYRRIGDLMIDIWDVFLARYGEHYAVCRFGDDLGFRTSTLLAPQTIREHILPQYKRVIDKVHDAGKPFLLHSCGKIFIVMDDLVALDIDAKHSNEDAIAPFDQWITLYGDRIGLLGGIDVDVLCQETPETIFAYAVEKGREYRKQALGYALGSGNSIPDYVPVEGYLAMVRAAQEIRYQEAGENKVMTETIDAVVAGHICLDVIPDLSGSTRQPFEQAFRPGRLVEVGDVAFSTGGPVANTGLALDRLGIKTQLMGKTGDDLYGHEIRRLCASSNPHLADGMVTDPSSSTSYTVVINPPQVDRIFLHFPGANDTFCAGDVRYDLVERSRLFHFGYPPLMRMMYENEGIELVEIFQRVKTTGVTTSLDMSLPDPSSASGNADWSNILRRTLPHVDIFLPSAEELLYMMRREMHAAMTTADDFLERVTPDLLTDMSDELLGLGAKIIAIKLGHRGFYLRTGGETAIESLGRGRPSDVRGWTNTEIWAPAFLVEEVGATGSGDSSIAGFLAALLRGLSPQEAVITATAVGAFNVEAADGLSGIRRWDDTHARVNSGWEKRSLSITESGWHFERGTELWQKTEN